MKCDQSILKILANNHKTNNILLDLINNWKYLTNAHISHPSKITHINNEIILHIRIKPYAIFEIDTVVLKNTVNLFLYHFKISKIHLISAIY